MATYCYTCQNGHYFDQEGSNRHFVVQSLLLAYQGTWLEEKDSEVLHLKNTPLETDDYIPNLHPISKWAGCFEAGQRHTSFPNHFPTVEVLQASWPVSKLVDVTLVIPSCLPTAAPLEMIEIKKTIKNTSMTDLKLCCMSKAVTSNLIKRVSWVDPFQNGPRRGSCDGGREESSW